MAVVDIEARSLRVSRCSICHSRFVGLRPCTCLAIVDDGVDSVIYLSTRRPTGGVNIVTRLIDAHWNLEDHKAFLAALQRLSGHERKVRDSNSQEAFRPPTV